MAEDTTLRSRHDTKEPIPLTLLAKAVHKFVNDDRYRYIIAGTGNDPSDEPGWTTGGCAILARALSTLRLDAVVVCIVETHDGRDQIRHTLVEIESRLLDANGLRTREQALAASGLNTRVVTYGREPWKRLLREIVSQALAEDPTLACDDELEGDIETLWFGKRRAAAAMLEITRIAVLLHERDINEPSAHSRGERSTA